MNDYSPISDERSDQSRDSSQFPSDDRVGETYTTAECPQCDRLSLTIVSPPESRRYCDGGGQPLAPTGTDVERPELKPVLRAVFDIPEPGIDICLYVAEHGPTSTDQIASAFDYDQSTATRYLNRLVMIGLLERVQLNRKAGGIINVYRPVPAEEFRRELLAGYYEWAGQTAQLLDELVDRFRERTDSSSRVVADIADRSEFQSVFWEEIRDSTENGA